MIDNINFNNPLPSDKGVSFLTKERMILYSIILILFFTVVYSLFSNKNLQYSIEDNKNKIELIQKQNDSLSKVNLDIRNKFSIFENNINNIDNKLYDNNQKWYDLNKKFDEEINNVDTYSYDKLFRAVSDRYDKNDIPH